MLFAGHIGITLAAAKGAPIVISYVRKRIGPPGDDDEFKRSWTETLDDRALIIGSILPDIVDKPLALVIAPALVGHSLRTIGHTIAFAVILLAVATVIATRSKLRWPLAMAFASTGHLALDMMWYSPRILLWPISASTFSPRFIHEWGPNPDAIYLIAEIVGVLIILGLAIRLTTTSQLRNWLLTGRS